MQSQTPQRTAIPPNPHMLFGKEGLGFTPGAAQVRLSSLYNACD